MMPEGHLIKKRKNFPAARTPDAMLLLDCSKPLIQNFFPRPTHPEQNKKVNAG
jgi:hypothetical protein